MDALVRFVFVLLTGVAGSVSGGLIVRTLLGERPRTGFDGVGEVFWGVAGGILLGLVLGFVISGRLDRTGRLWGIFIVIMLLGIEILLVNILS